METNKLQNYINNDDVLSRKKQLINANYKNSVKSLDDTKRQARIDAKVSNARLMKYIPQVLKNQGLSGNVGVSESALIDANNRHTTALGQIDANYNQGKAALDSEKQNNLLNLYTEAQTKIDNRQLERYNMMLSEMENWSGTSDELLSYLEENENALSEDQYANLKRQYESNRESIDKAYNNAQLKENFEANSGRAEGLANTDKGQNFHVKMDNKIYDLQVGTEYTASDSGCSPVYRPL